MNDRVINYARPSCVDDAGRVCALYIMRVNVTIFSCW